MFLDHLGKFGPEMNLMVWWGMRFGEHFGTSGPDKINIVVLLGMRYLYDFLDTWSGMMALGLE